MKRGIATMDYEVGYGKPPRHSLFKKGQPTANPRGRPRKDMAALLFEGLNKKVVVTENGRRRRITLREAITRQLINQSASADLRATKMLLDMIKDAEKQAAVAPPPEPHRRRLTRNNNGFTTEARKARRQSPHYQASTDCILESNRKTRLLKALRELRVSVVKLQ